MSTEAAAIKLIQDTAIKAAAIGFRIDDETVLIPGKDGGIEALSIEPPRRDHKVSTVEDLIKAATLAQPDQQWHGLPIVWHSHKLVRLVVDDTKRRDLVTLPLVEDDRFSTVCHLHHSRNDQELTQVMLIHLLRAELHGTVVDPGLIPLLRNLKFRRSSEGIANVQHGKESIDSDIHADVTGTGDLPETIELRVRVYSNLGEDEAWPITCDLVIEPTSQLFRLLPRPSEIEAAMQLAQGSIRQRLTVALPAGTPVFFGTP